MTPAQPFTVSAFLFGEDQDTQQALTQALHEQGVLGHEGVVQLRQDRADRPDDVGGARGPALGNRHPVVAEELLALIFE